MKAVLFLACLVINTTAISSDRIQGTGPRVYNLSQDFIEFWHTIESKSLKTQCVAFQ